MGVTHNNINDALNISPSFQSRLGEWNAPAWKTLFSIILIIIFEPQQNEVLRPNVSIGECAKSSSRPLAP